MPKRVIPVVRISADKKDQLEVNQLQGIDRLIKRNGWTKACEDIILRNISREDMAENVDYIFQAVEKYKPDHLVYRNFDRVGHLSNAELGHFVTEVKRRGNGTTIYLADEDRELDMNNMEDFIAIQTSNKEINVKRRRAEDARYKAVNNGSNPGKKAAYGYDSAVYDRKGTLKYKVINNGVTYQGVRQYRGRLIATYATMRTKVYPDGRTEEYNDTWSTKGNEDELVQCINCPSLDPGDRKTEIINPQRAKVVQRIFQLADYPTCYSPNQISTLVRDEYHATIESRGLCSRTISSILRNQIYKGFPVDNLRRKPDSKYDLQPYPLTDEQRQAICIIEPEQWDRVNHLLNQRPQHSLPHRKSRPNANTRWLRGYLICGNCNRQMYSHATRSSVTRYKCKRCGSVLTPVLHAMVDEWVSSFQQQCEQLADTLHLPDTDELWCQYQTEQICVGIRRLSVAREMALFILDRMPGNTDLEKLTAYRARHWKYFGEDKQWAVVLEPLPDSLEGVPAYRLLFDDDEKDRSSKSHLSSLRLKYPHLSLPNPDGYLVSIYTEVVEEHTAPLRQEIVTIDKQLSDFGAEFVSSIKSPTIRSSIEKAITTLENRKQSLETQSRSLVLDYRKLTEDIKRIADTVRKLGADLKTADGPQKAALLQPILKSVVVQFPPIGKTRCATRLVTVKITSTEPSIQPKTYSPDDFAKFYRIHQGRGRKRARNKTTAN